MPQLTKRSLRERRVPRNFDSDNEDPNSEAYIKNSYLKVDVLLFQQLKNPSLQLNADAKILIKFINSVNKSYRSYEYNLKEQGTQNIKQPSNSSYTKQKHPEISTSQSKKHFDLYRTENTNSKKIKQSNTYDNKNQNNDLFLNRIKTMTLQSAQSMRHLQMNYAKGKNILIDQNHKQPSNAQQSSLLLKSLEQSFKKKFNNHNNGTNGITIKNSIGKSILFVRDSQKMAKINEIQSKLGIPKSCFNESKLFKRSSYHVAISYYIYFKKLRQKGPIGQDVDPTFNAKRLKQQITKSG